MTNEEDIDGAPYEARQSQRDQEYRRQFGEWVASLSPEERRELESRGVAAPHVDAQGVGSPELDLDRVADPYFVPDFDFDSPDGDEPSPRVDESRILREVGRRTRRIVAEILEAKNARLTTECLALVTGVGFLGNSETEIARRFNVTRAAVSKRCVELCEKLGLPPARSMKSERARESYRASRIRSFDEQGKASPSKINP